MLENHMAIPTTRWTGNPNDPNAPDHDGRCDECGAIPAQAKPLAECRHYACYRNVCHFCRVTCRKCDYVYCMEHAQRYLDGGICKDCVAEE